MTFTRMIDKGSSAKSAVPTCNDGASAQRESSRDSRVMRAIEYTIIIQLKYARPCESDDHKVN